MFVSCDTIPKEPNDKISAQAPRKAGDNYSLRKKFQKELPNAIVVPLLRNQKVNAENSTFHRMVKEALEIENANKALEYHQRKQELTSSRTTKASQPTTTTRRVSFARNTTVTPTVGSARRSSRRPGEVAPPWARRYQRRANRCIEACKQCQQGGQRVQSETRSPVNLRRMESEDETRGEEHADTNVPEYEREFDYDYPTEVFDEYLDSEEDAALRSIQVDVDKEVNDPEESVSESSEPSPRLYGMSVTNESDHKERLAAIAESTGQHVAMRVTSQAKPRPKLLAHCMVAYGEVNGLKGKILFDSGSSINAISPAFAVVAKLTAFPLENP
ncbi:hypothetical protein BC629DRAFT_1445032 [Irpex lacteus]|nr:hypothetical protein BC629DRAFT_1445032 [Irpex lacteus]